jgi:hypothetical protein
MHTKAIMFYLNDRKDLCVIKKYEMNLPSEKKRSVKKKEY